MTTDAHAYLVALRQRIANLERDNRTLLGRVVTLETELVESNHLVAEWRHGFEGADRTIRRLTSCPESPLYGRTARVVMPDDRSAPVPITLHRARLAGKPSGLSPRDSRIVFWSGWLLMILALLAWGAVVTLRGTVYLFAPR